LPQFFDTVEKLYEIYEVTADVQAKLFIPLLNDHAKTVIGHMLLTALGHYVELKSIFVSRV